MLCVVGCFRCFHFFVLIQSAASFQSCVITLNDWSRWKHSNNFFPKYRSTFAGNSVPSVVRDFAVYPAQRLGGKQSYCSLPCDLEVGFERARC